MEIFGTILCVVGFLGILYLIGYAIYIYFGLIGIVIYITSVLCLVVGGSMITMDWTY